MRAARLMVTAVAAFLAVVPAEGAERATALLPTAHEEMGRALDDVAGQIHGLGSRWWQHFAPADRWPERPLITIMLQHRQELGLSPQQVDALERLRADFQKEVIRRDADIRVLEMDLAALLRAPGAVDLPQAETKVRELERLRADLRIERLRVMEQAKAQLTSEQRDKLARLPAQLRPFGRPAMPPSGVHVPPPPAGPRL